LVDAADRSASGGNRLDRQRGSQDLDVTDHVFEDVLEVAGDARDVRTRAAHVQGKNPVAARRAPRVRGPDHATGRTTQEAVLRPVVRARNQPPCARHHVQSLFTTANRLLDRVQVSLDDRQQISVDHGRPRAGQQLLERRHCTRTGDSVESLSLKALFDLDLVLGIAVAVHERHGHGVDPGLVQFGNRGVQTGLIEGFEHVPPRVHPFVDFDHQLRQRLGQPDLQRKQIRPLLRADTQEVCKTRGHHQRSACSLALEQRIRSTRGPESKVQIRKRCIERGSCGQARGEDRRFFLGEDLDSVALAPSGSNVRAHPEDPAPRRRILDVDPHIGREMPQFVPGEETVG
jgi:hypothetical protein